MSLIRTHAALLLGLLPALPTLVWKSDDMADADDRDTSTPTGREGVLDMLQQGMISTEEALDLLDGIEQADTSEAPVDPVEGADTARDADTGRARRRAGRPDRPDRPVRPGRPARPARAVRVGSDPDLGSTGGRRVLRIQVNDADGSHVNLGLPIGFIDAGLRVAERYSPGLLDGAVGASIRRAVGSGQTGTIIEVTEADGSLVRIAVD